MISGARSGPEGSDRDDRGDDDVDGDDVDGSLGHAGELVEQTPGVGDQHRLGHPEPADPAGLRFGERGFDDRRADDRHRHRALDVGQRLLAECLGERVGIGPTDACGACPARVDQLVLDPLLAQLLGLRGERWCAGGAEFGASFLAERFELLAAAARGVGVGTQPAARLHFVAPVDADVERAVADELLRRVAAAVACHVAGRHGHEVRGDADGVAEIGDA